MITYPNLPDGLALHLSAVESVAAKFDGYFDHPSCPYPATMKAYLKRMMRPEGVVGAVLDRVEVFKTEGDNFTNVLSEIQATVEELRALEHAEGLETSDRIALIRAKTTLLERWTALKERIFTLKELAEFQEMVIQTMESVLDVDQRSAFKEKLKKFRTLEA